MKKSGWQYWLYRIVRVFAIGYITIMLFACTMADRMIFMPPQPSYAATDEGVVRFGEAGEFSGFYFPAKEEGNPVLLWAHGNAEDAGSIQTLAHMFQAEGIGIMAYDYPGYGLSTGKPSEKGAYQSAEAAFDFLVQEQKENPKSIVLLGQSVGGGPSTYLAAKRDAAGLVLISPFKSAFRVVTKVKIVPWDRFDNWKRITEVEVPLLVIHGDADEVVPFAHGQALFERYEGDKEFLRLEGVGHNDLWFSSADEVVAAVSRFSKNRSTPSRDKVQGSETP